MDIKLKELRTPEHNILIGEIINLENGETVLRVKKGKNNTYENVPLSYLQDQFALADIKSNNTIKH